MKLFLYASSICPLSTTIKAHSYYHVVLLYCLDKSGRTVVLQPTRYETYIQLEPELESMEGFKNTSRLDFLFPGDVESPHSEEEYKGKFVSKVEIEHKVQLLGFNNSQKVPVLKVSMRNEKSRRTLQYALAKNDNDYGPIKIKQVLHTKIPADTQFLYDTNLQLGSWIECEGAYVPKKVNVDELFDAENVTFLHVQAANLQPCAVQDEPATMRKAYIRIAAHSSTATKTNQYDPSYDIDKDEVRYICLQLDNEKPIVLDIEKCGNTEQGLLEMFGTIMREADVHVLVFSSDERCSPNSLVYLYERSKRYGINLHFSKLKTHEIKCVQRQVGENNMFLDFVHPGVDRVNISEVLKKAQVSPPLDGFRILDALRHEKLIAKDAKPRFKSLLSLNYQGYNFNSTPQQIMEDLKINTNLLATLENNNEFVASQQGIAKICTLSLTSVVERGQQARITNFLFRAFDKNGIYVNDKQLENVYTVIKRMQKNSSFPLPPEINNPDISEMNGEKPPRHVIKCNKLPPHLAFLYDLDHNNVFEPEDPEPDFKELMPNYPKKEFDIIESKAMDYAHILPKFNDMTLLVQDDEDDDEGDKPRKRDVEETQDSKQTGYEKPWWSSKTAADFAPKSKKRKVAPKKRYSGGLVLKPVAGFYIKDEHATATVDWSSLYPSIIIAHLICYMRLIFDKKWLDDPLLVCDYIPITDSECLILAKTYNGVPVQTILPEVVSDVMQLRKDIRAEQKGFEYGSFKWNVFERAQLAAKCVANSLYGFLGSDTSVLPITALAAAVTCLGQFQNKNLKFAFIFAGYLIVYGDTDSLFLISHCPPHLKTRDEKLSFIYARTAKMTAFGSAMFPKPNSLENENYKNPFLMTDKKKTYIAWQMSPKPNGWNLTGKDAPQLGIKGFVFKKRSKCGFAQDIGLDLAKKIMSGKDFTIPDMRLWLKEELKKIPTGNIKTIDELNNFIITCSLNSDYKSTENLALHLADSIESFSGARPRVGTRLPFLVAYMPQQRLHFKTCITPDYFLSDSNLVIDIEYYVTKQISKCLEQILCLPVHQSLCFALQEVMDDFVLTWGLRQTKQNEMGVFFTSNSAETAPLDQTEQNRKKRLRENNEIFKKFRKPVVLTKKPKK